VAFWSNHLCVSTAVKVLVVPLAGSYEREVTRPHVLGRFEDMVLASARHPAMLVYLDNFQSIGPNSLGAARRRGRGPRGLNENYARELLELHTLDVNGGYAQQDVEELAKILTGWTVTGLQGGGPTIGFQFQDVLHEPGPRTVLGVRYTEGGVAQGERVIRDLCRHASTSRFIATKLVTHFVADVPPAAAIDRIAQVFRASDGDLRAVAVALIDINEAWSDDVRKFRTPQDWLVAALRAVGAREMGQMTVPVLRQLRHPRWAPQSPKGFGDSVQEWADPDSLLNRAELAERSRVARGPIRLTRAICSTWLTWPQAIPCVRCSQTRRLPPPTVLRWPLPDLRFSGDDHGPSDIREKHVPGRDRHLRPASRHLCSGPADRPVRIRAPARRVRRSGRRGPVRRPRLPLPARRSCVREIGSRRAHR
jgi:uncharacterized protein (DUF1800 family)